MKSIEELDLENGRSISRGKITYLPEPIPNQLFCPIISVDDHVLEPADLFTNRVAKKFRESIPHVEYDKDSVPSWVIGAWRDSMRMTTCGPVGRPMSEWSLAPQKYDEFRLGVYDVNARVKDMDLNGVVGISKFSIFSFRLCGTSIKPPQGCRTCDRVRACLQRLDDYGLVRSIS